MSDKNTCKAGQLVPQAMRHAVVGKLPQIARLLGLDASMDDDELYAEVLRLCLFDKRDRKNPHAVFQDRLNHGDFLPVQPNEDPDNLRPGREPMTYEQVDVAVARAKADAVFWNGKTYASVIDIVRAFMLTA